MYRRSAWLASMALVIACGTGIRQFPDRPPALQEHDDAHVAKKPDTSRTLNWSGGLEDSVAGEIDRHLAMESAMPARDVNALDEVPCSTWFCARNHVRPLTVQEIAAGPSDMPPPVAPFRIVEGKNDGEAQGFIIKDARDKKYLIKLDPTGHLAMTSGAEAIGTRFAYAAGYNTPAAYVVDINPNHLSIDPKAKIIIHGYDERPFTQTTLAELLDAAGRLNDGNVRGVAVAWISGDVLGPFHMKGTRKGDPNDRIPHQHRRSLRASWVLMGWLRVFDATRVNTLDSYVDEGGRKFVRHYFIDFAGGIAAGKREPGAPDRAAEAVIEHNRTVTALFSFGLYQRKWQGARDEYIDLTARYPAIGYFPAEGWDPEDYRTVRRVPAHQRMTDRDAYWGAKIVTSFTDEQIRAVVATAGYPQDAARYLEHALRTRRNTIGRKYLTRVTAVEEPKLSANGHQLCFVDLAITRGAAHASQVSYRWRTLDTDGDTITSGGPIAGAARTCIPIGECSAQYRVIAINATVAGEVAKATRVHVARRESERRCVVVGMERDE